MNLSLIQSIYKPSAIRTKGMSLWPFFVWFIH